MNLLWNYFGNEEESTSTTTTQYDRVKQKLNKCKFLQDKQIQTCAGKLLSQHDIDAHILSSEELVLDKYLHTEFDGYELLEDETNFASDDSDNEEDVTSSSVHCFLASRHTPQLEKLCDTVDDFVLVEHAEQSTISTTGPLKIKLFISDANVTGLYARVAKAYLSYTNQMPAYGFCHVGLIVGPWKLEWLDYELVIPKQAKSSSASICVDLATIKSKQQLDLIRTKLANLIVKWNTQYTYKESGASPEKEHAANCHQFVDVVLQELQLQQAMEKLPASFKHYLGQLRCTGKAEMQLQCSPSFQHRFKLSHASKSFATHEELDLFVQYCFKKDVNFAHHYWDEYFLLKSFDRAFWLRFQREQKGTNRPIQKNDGACNCPFNNPMLTNSILPFFEQHIEVE